MRNSKVIVLHSSLGRVRHKLVAAGAAISGAMLSGAAFAQTSGADGLQTAISSELAGAKPVLYGIGGLILGAIAVLVVIRLAKRGANS